MRVVAALSLAAWWLGAVGTPCRAAEAYSADAVKAAFLYRFTGYIEWPMQAVSGPNFTIEVLGADGLATELQALLDGRTIKNWPVRVRAIRDAHVLGSGQMLYIGAGYRGDLRALLGSISDRPMLIVTDTERGLDSGSIINFLPVDQRVRFEVSIAAAERSGLMIGSELLSVAARVQGTPSPHGTRGQVSDARP